LKNARLHFAGRFRINASRLRSLLVAATFPQLEAMNHHRQIISGLVIVFICFLIGSNFYFSSASAQNPNIIDLENNWRIQPAQQAAAEGQTISTAQFDASTWHPASVPATVLSALVKDGVYRNIFFGTNLDAVPTQPFQYPWWYRTEFDLPTNHLSGADLIFDGINYRANIWLNGQRIAGTNNVFGAFRIFNFSVGHRLKSGKNVLAVEVFPPRPGDFTVGFVDWNPRPPDHNLGLFRPVKLHFYHEVALEHLFVESKINHKTWKTADLTVCADLANHANHPLDTTVSGQIGDVDFSQKFALLPHETRSIKITPATQPELKFRHPHLWWPWELGNPYLYTLKLAALVDGKIADHRKTRFGIREVDDYFTAEGYRGYKINGKKILIRGGGWADDLLLNEDPKKLATQIQYIKAMNLNTIRLEGIWGSSQRLYNLADQYGLLIMAGWSCQWEWTDYLGKKCDEFGGFKSEADMDLATNYLTDQVLWLRHHPSIFVWALGSDMLPRPELEKRYDALLATIDPTRPTLKSCGDKTSEVSGPTGVKMNGPYDYVTPDYWYLDKKHGGAFGFNTETSPGPEPPPLESLKRMLPAGELWPINRFWNFHCARGEFGQFKRYQNAFANRYGKTKSVEEFAFKSQAANYEAIRPMFEAFAVNLPHTTGIIQWMLNASWPKLYWQLYDYYLMPGGAFFGAKKGASPVAVIYNYGDHGIYVVNQIRHPPSDWRTAISVYDANSREILHTNVVTRSPYYGSKKIFDLTGISPTTSVFFVDLKLQNASGKKLADNFYWLSMKPDVLDESKSTWYVTPNKSFADFTELNHLPEAQVRAAVSFTTTTNGTDAHITLINPGKTLAFFMQMNIVNAKSQQTLLPVFWSDNYISLPPGAQKTYHAHLPSVATHDALELRLKGWNVKSESVR
jgi:exo-1,4-beta-D-glucosaminidase